MTNRTLFEIFLRPWRALAAVGLRGFMLNLSVEGAAGYHDLLKLLPKIQEAVGSKACRKLERALLE